MDNYIEKFDREKMNDFSDLELQTILIAAKKALADEQTEKAVQNTMEIMTEEKIDLLTLFDLIEEIYPICDHCGNAGYTEETVYGHWEPLNEQKTPCPYCEYGIENGHGSLSYQEELTLEAIGI